MPELANFDLSEFMPYQPAEQQFGRKMPQDADFWDFQQYPPGAGIGLLPGSGSRVDVECTANFSDSPRTFALRAAMRYAGSRAQPAHQRPWRATITKAVVYTTMSKRDLAFTPCALVNVISVPFEAAGTFLYARSRQSGCLSRPKDPKWQEPGCAEGGRPFHRGGSGSGSGSLALDFATEFP